MARKPTPEEIVADAQRDYWPALPTREDCVAVKFPCDFQSLEHLKSVWPSLSVAEKAELGFTAAFQRGRIERLLEQTKGAKQ